jgi:hypothetical protein
MSTAAGSSLPMLMAPHDTMRKGLPALKEDATIKHPMQQLQNESKKQVWQGCVTQVECQPMLYFCVQQLTEWVCAISFRHSNFCWCNRGSGHTSLLLLPL